MTVDELETEIRALSPNDRAQLFIRLGLPEEHRVSRKLPSVLNDWIRIDDSMEHQGRPQIAMERKTFGNGDIGEHTIDILGSIKVNPASIGHPLILVAILRWTEMIRRNRALSGKVPSSKKKYKIAEQFLKRVGKVLIEGAKQRAIPKEYALLYSNENLGAHWYGILHDVWKILADSEINGIKRYDFKIQDIQQRLKDSDHSEKGIEGISVFLMSDEGKLVMSKRQSWLNTLSIYEAWRVGLQQDTYRRYKHSASKQGERERSDHRFTLDTDFNYFSVTTIADALGDWSAWPTT